MKAIAGRWRFMAERWPTLSFYQRLESVLAFALTLIITLVILVALYGLLVDVIGGLALGRLDPLEHRAFQLIFGEIITVLIALEFNHTLLYVVTMLVLVRPVVGRLVRRQELVGKLDRGEIGRASCRERV